MATIKLNLDLRRQKKDGTYPLVFLVVYNSKPIHIKTGISLSENEFDFKNALVKNKPQLNKALYEQERLYRDKLHRLSLNYSSRSLALNSAQIKIFLEQQESSAITLAEYWEKIIEHLLKCKRYGGAKVHRTSLNAVKKQLDINIPIPDFSYSMVVKLEEAFFRTGVSVNGMGVYFRSLRFVCNSAIKENIVDTSWYPFKNYRIRKTPTVPRVLNLKDLSCYFNYPIEATHPDFYYWNIGKLLFMLRGINITDLLLLTKDNIKGEYLIYKRRKTNKIYSIKINEAIGACLDYFNGNNTLLGLINLEELNSPKIIEILTQKRKTINHHLKKIGVKLGIHEPITTYVFRYSYANTAKQLGYFKDLIAEALGHEYGNSVTGIYLEQFDQDLIDSMNKCIFIHIFKKNYL
jgi:integrase